MDRADTVAGTPNSPSIAEMAIMIARLSYALKLANPSHEGPAKATAYLTKHNLLGSPLRAEGQGGLAAVQDKRQQGIGAAIERACRVLPEGYEVHIELERGAGTPVLYNPEGERQGEFCGDGFADKINNAISYAVARDDAEGLPE